MGVCICTAGVLLDDLCMSEWDDVQEGTYAGLVVCSARKIIPECENTYETWVARAIETDFISV